MSKSNLKRYDLREDFKTLPRGNPSYYVEVSMTDALGSPHVWKVYAAPDRIEKKERELRAWCARLQYEGVICDEWSVSEIKEEWH